MKDLRQAAQRVLEVLVRVNASPHLQDLHHAFDEEINDLQQALAEPDYWQEEARRYAGNADYWRKRYEALAEPEQGPISLNGGRLTQYPDGRIGFGTLESVGAIGHAPTPRKPEQEPVAWRLYKDGELYALKFEAEDRGPHYRWEPLYTAPPQREHITDGSPCWCNPDVFEEGGGNVIVHNYEDNWQQYAKPGETAQQCIERHRSEQDALMKLYATPRKPLTDEELEPLLGALPCYDIGNSDLVNFARAVIAAYEAKQGEQT